MNSESNMYMDLSHSENLRPQEEVLETTRNRKNITIGIPKETSYQEKRIALAPDAIGTLVGNGHKVNIEKGAGENAYFSDAEYIENGASIYSTPDEIFKSDIILKVAPPVDEEIDMMKDKQYLISSLHLTAQNRDFFKKLALKRITGIAYELVKNRAGTFPLRRIVSEIAGKESILIASRYLSSMEHGSGKLLGGFPGIPPVEVVILGAGTVGENAANVAIGLGAQVKVFDHSTFRLRRLCEKVNTNLYTCTFQPKMISKALESADVVIGSIHSAEGKSPCLVTEEMVSKMKTGSVIIDVSIDQGGCFETSRLTTHNNPVFKAYDVTHFCVPNISSRVPNTASFALSNFLAPIFLRIGEIGGIENLLRDEYGISKGVYLYNGMVTNRYISEHFTLPFQDLDLILAAFRG
ncbi:alanine dehydrogenase [Bacteroidota bacterium]